MFTKMLSVRLATACALLFVMPAAQAAPKTENSRKAETAASSGRNDAEAVELLRAIEKRHGSSQSVSGSFQQSKRVAGSPSAIKTVASFSLVKPNKFRADYFKPGQENGQPMTTNLIVGRDSWEYVRDLEQVSHYRFQDEKNVRDFNYLLLGFGAHTEDLLKVYRVTNLEKAPRGYRGLRLLPLDPRDAGFKYITLLVTDDANLLPAQFSMVQADDSQVTVDLDLNTLQLGARVNEKIFRPDFPDADLVEMN